MSITIDFSDYKYEAGDLDDEIQRANDATLADFIVYLVRNDKEDNAKQRFNEIIRPHIRESLSQDHSGTLKAILGKHLLPLGHDRLAAIINKYMAILAPASKKRAVYAYTLHLMNSASVLFEMVNQVQQNAPEAKPSKKPRKITVPDTATANGQLLKDVEKTIENLKTSGKCIEGWYTQSWLKQVVAGNYSFGESIPEYRFNDPDGVLRNIRQAAKVLMECVKAEEFNLGMKLVRALLKIEVPVDGDLEGEEKLWLGELYLYGALKDSGNTKKDKFLAAIYLTLYMCRKNVSSRVNSMKTALPLIFQSRSIYPEQMKKLYGDDLPEFGEFLEGWIQFLRQDHQPDILIEEAEKFLASMKDS